ncbi:MAG: single-stranded DNA-binding protein [Candidatus Omnitrophica bacterium]|nr:single-stranded DNA-binding protein [Candidatus Omnitrophota bacterium]MBI3009809.1 single-stranded DNA-binding protein [Candidatus Omnitrophota bacterium]
MVNLNRVLLIGNLTKDPELRYTPAGTPVANLRLAVNSIYKDQAGQKKEDTCFVTIVVWSKQAELCNQYLKKGRSIFVEGRLIYRSWEAEGKTRSTMEVRADRVQFLGGPAGSSTSGSSSQARAESPATAQTGSPEGIPSLEEGAEADVPF